MGWQALMGVEMWSGYADFWQGDYEFENHNRTTTEPWVWEPLPWSNKKQEQTIYSYIVIYRTFGSVCNFLISVCPATQTVTVKIVFVSEVEYVCGNTSNMLSHLREHHPNVSISGTKQKRIIRRVLLPTGFIQPLTTDLDCAKVITKAIEVLCDQI